MKTIQSIILAFGLLCISHVGLSQSNKIETIEIDSSIQCGMCVDRLENSFADYWAVKNVEYIIKDQKIIVTYNKKKTTPDEIREHIAMVGYDADEVEANQTAYDSLPKCCKKGAHIPEK